ncbi:MAG: penicillin-binding protein 1C [Oligoflexus sp.]|nr:penicillin-binding protein 1C [Oligoflexus sp.]
MKGFLIGLFVLVVSCLGFVLPWQSQPTFEAVKANYQSRVRSVFDRHGTLIEKQRLNTNSRRLDWIELGDVPRATRNAIVLVEDRRFYEHAGVDLIALGGLPYNWLKSGRLRGASTISMQLTVLLEAGSSTQKKSLRAKLRQIISAWRIERQWNKNEILEAYLNLVPFRSNLEGLRAASQGLFQKEPHGLSEVESVALANLIASPNASGERIARKVCRFLKVLDCKTIQNILAGTFAQKPRLPRHETIAPHFLRGIGQERDLFTTLDSSLQTVANETVTEQIASLGLQNVHDASVLVADYRTGEVLAYVGSSGRYSKAPEVDGVRAKRQAGSTLKPFLYSEAFNEDLIAVDTLLLDKGMQIQTSNGIYAPQNYDGSYRGVVSVREALASSLNIPAIRVIEMLGIDRFYSVLERLGFSLANRQTYGHSLALGSLDVSLWQLVKAYGVLARGGSDWQMTLNKQQPGFQPPRNILRSKGASWVARILSDKDSRASTFRLDNVLATPYWTAVKTGTSKDMRDNWCLGFSDRYVVGVWVGNFDGSPMWSVSGVTGAAPIWRRVMDQLHGNAVANQSFPLPMSTDELGEKPILKAREAKTILYPLEKTVIAFDPDIPLAQQVLVFESEEALPKSYFWKLDGIKRKSGFVKLADLKSGHHTLEISDSGEHAADQVQFEVRGLPEELGPNHSAL